MHEPLNISFVMSSADQGGAERQTETLARRLAERGHRCRTVVVKGDPPSGVYTKLGAERYLDWRAVTALRDSISNDLPDLLFAVNGYALMYTTLARLRAAHRPRIVVSYHSTQLLDLKEHVQTLAYRPFFWASDCAVFVSARQHAHWRRRALMAKRNEVIHNGIDPAAYSNDFEAHQIAEMRESLGFGHEDYVIAISAWLRPEKNHVQLVDALAALLSRGVPARLLIIGDGPRRHAVEQRARELGVERFVFVTGAQRDVRPYLALADVVAICSIAVETFSLAALEAMAMGKPVVHSDLGGAAEMIEPGRNGFLFPVNDTEALVEKLATLSDRELARQLGAEARTTVRSRFSETRMVDRYEQLLASIINRVPGRIGNVEAHDPRP